MKEGTVLDGRVEFGKEEGEIGEGAGERMSVGRVDSLKVKGIDLSCFDDVDGSGGGRDLEDSEGGRSLGGGFGRRREEEMDG